MDYIYIVAGDRMKEIMEKKYPDRIVIPFKEDMSKGHYNGYLFSDDFISNRITFWKVKKETYLNHMKDIINLDFDKNYILCFGNDDTCKANLVFLINYLRKNGYQSNIKVQIVDEISLDIKNEYII